MVGTNSVIRHDIPDNVVVSGNPAQIICSIEEFTAKHKEKMQKVPVYDTYWADKTEEEKQRQIEELEGQMGYDI